MFNFCYKAENCSWSSDNGEIIAYLDSHAGSEILDISIALLPKRGNKNIKYFIHGSGNRTHVPVAYTVARLHSCATMAFFYFKHIFQNLSSPV